MPRAMVSKDSGGSKISSLPFSQSMSRIIPFFLKYHPLTSVCVWGARVCLCVEVNLFHIFLLFCFLGPAIIFHRLCVAGESDIRPDVPSDDEEEEEEEEEEGQANPEPQPSTQEQAPPKKKVQKIVGLVGHSFFSFFPPRPAQPKSERRQVKGPGSA